MAMFPGVFSAAGGDTAKIPRRVLGELMAAAEMRDRLEDERVHRVVEAVIAGMGSR